MSAMSAVNAAALFPLNSPRATNLSLPSPASSSTALVSSLILTQICCRLQRTVTSGRRLVTADCSREHSKSFNKLTITPQAQYLSFSSSSTKQIIKFPVSKTNHLPNTTTKSPLYATLNSPRPRGFGPSPKKTKKAKKPKTGNDSDDDEDEEEDEAEAGVIPEIVTNRMISRIGFTVGIPLFIGLLFFPFFYYLKVVLKIDVPSWVPVIVSFIFFGTALLGVSYGIVSSSWDPLREGSLLGWNEAQRNWPVFWQSLWSGGGYRKK